MNELKQTLPLALVLCSGLSGMAQGVTYNHDPIKMNQITVQETGVGTLTPPAYYDLLHRKYASLANIENKAVLRTGSSIYAQKQVAMAEKFDSVLIKRAEIEALNMADRQVDLAWSAEQQKIEIKLSDFQRNINRIFVVGGSRDQCNLWTMEYNKFSTAIKAVREGYMPNSQRKNQYMRIYSDVRKANDTLLKYLVSLSRNKLAGELLSARYTKPDNVGSISSSALTRWRGSAWKIIPGGRPGGGSTPPVSPSIPPDKPSGPNVTPPPNNGGKPPGTTGLKPIGPITDKPFNPKVTIVESTTEKEVAKQDGRIDKQVIEKNLSSFNTVRNNG